VVEKAKQEKGNKQEVAVVGDKTSKNAITALAQRLQISAEELNKTLRETAFKECKTEAQFIAALVVANTYGLNPLLKEVTAFPGSGGGVIPVVMIDGWISLVTRHPKYNGVKLTENRNPEGKPNKSGTIVDSITVEFYVKGQEFPVVVTEYMDECWDGTKNPWKKWPIRMLRHKAYIQGARVAFGFSGIYDEDEKDRIQRGEILDIPGEPMVDLRNNKDKSHPVEEPTPEKKDGDESTAAPVEVVDDTNKPMDIGDLNRFGQANSAKAKYMFDQIIKGHDLLGHEKFMEFLGGQSYTMLTEITKFEDLVKFTNALLAELKGKE
jgi:phage recombination protein Bet